MRSDVNMYQWRVCGELTICDVGEHDRSDLRYRKGEEPVYADGDGHGGRADVIRRNFAGYTACA